MISQLKTPIGGLKFNTPISKKWQERKVIPEIQALKSELAELKQFRDEYTSEKSASRMENEDKVLSQEVDSIRKQFPNIDFDTPDENGKSLEMKVLDHAQSMGLDGSKPGHFRSAFRDFYHDQLISRAKDEGKETVSKTIQKQTKLGLLGETSKPTRGLKVAENVKNKSYEALLQEAIEESRSGRIA
jgi:hypothetical protein